MAVDTALYPAALNTTIPTASDFVSEGDDNFRQVKTCLKTTFSNVNGALTATHTEFNYVTGVTSAIQTQLNDKAPKDSPTFTTAATLPAATTIGTVTAAEILRLSGVTSPIQTQLDSKGAIAGQTWTGTHNFTGGSVAVPTLPPGSTGNGAASVDFANSLAFASALPGISASTAGKVTGNNGVTAGWVYPYLPIVDVTGTSATATASNRYRLKNVAATTLTLPASPSDGDIVAVNVLNGLTTNVIARNGQLLFGLAEDHTLDTPAFPMALEFRTGYGWGLLT